MTRKRIPLITRPDASYAAALLPAMPLAPYAPVAPPLAPFTDRDLSIALPALAGVETPGSIKVDVRANALQRQEAALLECGILPAQVIRAALRRAVKGWALAPHYLPPAQAPRLRHSTWAVRTSLAVDAAAYDRIQAAHDPLGICSRWSLIRGQLEPVLWQEIDQLLEEIEDRSGGD